MPSRLRRHLSFANMLSFIALFVALGGVGYAATQLPRNSVGAKQVKRGAITGAKVRNGSLTAADFKASARVRLRGADGEPGQLGPAGPGSATAGYQRIASPPGTSAPLTAQSAGDLLTSVDLPAGSYLLFGTVQLRSGLDQTYVATCRLVAGDTLDSSSTGGPSDSVWTTTTLQAVIASTTPITVAVRCNATVTQSSEWREARVSAVKVETLG